MAANHLPISITARSIVCPVGASLESFWNNLLTGKTGIRHCPELGLGDQCLAARVPDAMLARTNAQDRTEALIMEAALQIKESPAWASINPQRLGVCLGTTQGPIQSWEFHQKKMYENLFHRPPLPSLSEPANTLARLLGAAGPVNTISMACASGTAAIGLGILWIRNNICDAVIAGGVDALSAFVYTGFESLRALDHSLPRPFDRQRAGLGLGEGAALVLLQPGLFPSKTVAAGWGISSDAHHLTGPDPSGAGLARAIRAALTDAGVTPQEIDFFNAHGTGTVFNDLMESKALGLVFGEHACHIPTNSIKGSLGHTLAAAGAIEAVLCSLVLEKGIIPPTANLVEPDPAIPLDVVYGSPRRNHDMLYALSTSAGFGGINAALILKRTIV